MRVSSVDSLDIRQIIGASVASTPLEADGNFSIYLYIIYIYIFIYLYGVAGILDTRILREGVAAQLLQCRGRGSVLHVHALSTITGCLLRTVARYAEVHSALQPAGEAARL